VIIQNAVPRGSLGIATASMSFLRSLGGAFGVALSGCVMHYVFNSIARMERAAGADIHLAEALRPPLRQASHWGRR